MAVFNDINLSWKGKEYKIAGDDKIMVLICQIEDVLTIDELSSYMTTQKVKLGKLSQAFAVVLNYAVCKVTSSEVYENIFTNDNVKESVAQALTTLMLLVMPKDALEGEDGKKSLAQKKNLKKNSSKKSQKTKVL